MMIVAVSDREAWTSIVSPHGLVHGPPDGMLFGSTDLRYPVLRRYPELRRLLKEPTSNDPGTEAEDQASSLFAIGTNAEKIRTHIDPGELVISDRGSLPFGPWPEQRIALESLWTMDASWKHGLAGRAVVLGQVTPGDLALPPDWQVREAPLGLAHP